MRMKTRKSTWVLSAMLALAIPAFATDKFTTIYAFQGGASAGNPAFQLVEDAAGNLYGTTFWGGNMHACKGQGCGVAFRLSPLPDGQWKYTELYQFFGGDEPFLPSNLILDAAGNLYGESMEGPGGSGSVFELSPTASGPWKFTTLYTFNGSDGYVAYGGLVFDAAGNLYGTTQAGGTGSGQAGVVFELSPQAGGGWSEKTIWNFSVDSSVGSTPYAGVVIDAAGNLYGTTTRSTSNYGAVYELSPGPSGWTATALYTFTGSSDGAEPIAPVTIDASGNLYGTTSEGGAYDQGTVFELSPTRSGDYSFSVLHAFTSGDGKSRFPVTLSASGNLLGVTYLGGVLPYGTIFQLSQVDDNWLYDTVHAFSNSDGARPNNLIMDSAGNFYGVASYGEVAGCSNSNGCGTIFKLTP